MRLDIYLNEKNIFPSREKARQAILSSAVSVNGKIINKPSLDVSGEDIIEIIKDVNPYVGRGGLKLAGAIEIFDIDLNGVYALDVGASTGGFTDCMLKNGAVFVCACDVGKDQLDPSLRNDKRVLSLEKTDIRNLAACPEKYGITKKFDFASVDVSFISLTKVLPFLKDLISPGARVVCLIKPQFEMENRRVGKNGIIRDDRTHRYVCEKIKDFSAKIGYTVCGTAESPIKGGDGNREFLIYLKYLS